MDGKLSLGSGSRRVPVQGEVSSGLPPETIGMHRVSQLHLMSKRRLAKGTAHAIKRRFGKQLLGCRLPFISEPHFPDNILAMILRSSGFLAG
jgi:hypothetical protein